MTKGIGRVVVLVCAASALIASRAPAQTGAKSAEKPGAPPSGRVQPPREESAIPPPVLEEMAKYTAPGPHHRDLEAFAGKWITRTRVWENPEARPLEFPGSAECRMILGGRFLQLDSRSLLNGVENHGLGLYGYDSIKEKYSFYFIHDGETQALAGLGDGDSTGRQITFEVTMDMPSTGERAKPMRTVLRRATPDRHVFEMFEKYLDGRDWKVLEITYDRAR